MPHVPDSLHPTHELELVAAYAAGDATGPDLARAESLVASCADCAALHADLRAIAAALPSVPVPARPRDFRIAPEQAATLRPRGLRGILASLSGPKFAFATPLGTGLAALGIVGVLVASGGAPLVGTGGSTAQGPEVAIDGTSNGAGAAAADQATPPAELAPGPTGVPTTDPLLATGPSPSDAAASDAPDMPQIGAAASSQAPASTAPGGGVAPSPSADDQYAMTAPTGAPEPSAEARLDAGSPGDDGTTATKALADEGGQPLLLPAAGLVLAGLALLVVRIAARRLA